MIQYFMLMPSFVDPLSS